MCLYIILLLVSVSDDDRGVLEEVTAQHARIPGGRGSGLVDLGRDQLQEVLLGQVHLRQPPAGGERIN